MSIENDSSRVPASRFREFLRKAAPWNSRHLDELFDRLCPGFEFNHSDDRNLFQAVTGSARVIRVGLKGTVRLQAHAYAGAITLLELANRSSNTSCFACRMPTAVAELFSWAVNSDLEVRLKQHGIELSAETALPGGKNVLPSGLLAGLTQQERAFGQGLFLLASAYILLHELAHLNLAHGSSTHENEKEADQFAADWLCWAVGGASLSQVDRMNAIFGTACALLWLTTPNVFFGRAESLTHPEGYDRLYQVLERVIDPDNDDEHLLVWDFVARTLSFHMWSGGFDFDPVRDAWQPNSNPKDEANRLIDRIANSDRKR